MAVPFDMEEESTAELLALCQRLMQELYHVLRQILRQQQQAAAASPRIISASRLPSCEEEAAGDDGPEEPPPAAEGQTEPLNRRLSETPDLPDVVPRPAPRQRERSSGPSCATASQGFRRKASASSSFTKYLTLAAGAGPCAALATSDTTACFALPLEDSALALPLPDLLCSVPTPSVSPPPSPAPRQSPQPLPRRKRRLRKTYRASSCPTWEHEEGLDKALLSKMAAAKGRAYSSRPGPWMRVGEDLRHIADEFSDNLKPCDEVDSGGEKSLLSLILPQAKGTIWTTVVLLVGWRLLARMR